MQQVNTANIKGKELILIDTNVQKSLNVGNIKTFSTQTAPMSDQMTEYVQGSFFEEDYLVRTLGTLATSPEIALTELVANAWDAGATNVNIFIPEDYHNDLVIEDNGLGITKDEFHTRWMRLGYNRLKHQGKNVIFPKNIEGKRIAYGRNGVGRHGLLCFNNEYRVITASNAQESTFVIQTVSEIQPFVIKSETFKKAKKHGTRLVVNVAKNLPNAKRILDIISAKFLHDPNFKVSINGETVPLEQHTGLINSTNLIISDIKLSAHFIDTQKSGRSTIYQGIAFWQGRRLVGEPSWILGRDVVIDGRTKFAKRYTVVVETDDLAEYIKEDWTGFKNDPKMDEIYKAVGTYVQEQFATIAQDTIEETKQNIRHEFAQDYSKLSALGKYEVNIAIEQITAAHPTARPEAVTLAVEAIINLEKTRSGKELLLKLSQFTEDDAAGLNKLLESWSIRDALTVLEEIDSRITVIEAIRKLSKDKDVDELHVLHPLVTKARWLFGPEFESAEYSSNRQLHTAVETVFKKKIQPDVFNNHKKRPDIVVLQDSTLSVTATDSFDSETHLSTLNKILIIELKRGGFKLSKEERNQAVGYVEEFMNCGALIGNPHIDAFVIGESFSEKLQPTMTVSNDNKVDMGKIHVTTFAQLVDTAERRLFGLRKRLNERYDDIPGVVLAEHSEQLSVNF